MSYLFQIYLVIQNIRYLLASFDNEICADVLHVTGEEDGDGPQCEHPGPVTVI